MDRETGKQMDGTIFKEKDSPLGSDIGVQEDTLGFLLLRCLFQKWW
jgi:hypothetical protein